MRNAERTIVRMSASTKRNRAKHGQRTHAYPRGDHRHRPELGSGARLRMAMRERDVRQ